MPSAEQLRSRLSKKLKELFQLDQPDLDFGFYRIMHAKAEQVQEFIENDLLKIVEDAFGQVDETRKEELRARIEREIQAAREYGVPDPENSPKVTEAYAEYNAVKDSAGSEAGVYDHLYRFFERYYDAGDFISRRYYTRETPGKAAPFAVPYNGEEVKLHWANADQYYIKTAEYFTHYTFDLRQTREFRARNKKDQIDVPSGQKETSPLKVHFRIADAAEGEHGNVKATDANKRLFIIHHPNPVEVNEEGELVVNFEYRPDPEKSGQEKTWREKRNAQAVETILEQLEAMMQEKEGHREALSEYLRLLTIPAPTGKDKKRPLLARYITQYTARNTMDYFIHKDLGGFLRRELDFYIKNEVMRLDDIEEADAPAVESYLAKIRVLRNIAGKLIDFLAQLEDFQKKLWLKKKFVVETNYCITLDRVPEELYPDIAANDAQTEEWVRLFAIDEIEADLHNPGYTKPLTQEFLRANDKLVLDTRFFDGNIKARLVASIGNLDDQCDGLLIHSENFQALNLLQKRYREQVKCVYIDPPYNTDASPIAYKNSYRNSSWMSLIENRLIITKPLCDDGGILCVTIDDFEQKELESVIEATWGMDNILGVVAIRNNPSGRPTSLGFAVAHEYAIFVSKIYGTPVKKLHRSEALDKRYKERDEVGKYMWELLRKRGSDSERKDNPKAFFPFYVSKLGKIRLPDMEWDDSKKIWTIYEEPKNDELAAYPIDDNGTERRWRWGIDKAKNQLQDLKVNMSDGGNYTIYYKYRPPEGVTATTNWIESKYSSTEHGTGLLKKFFTDYDPFSFPKSIYAVQDCLVVSGIEDHGTVLDYFAGSGTTSHAVINLNREDDGKRKYILIEMGDYFDTILKPRIAKVIYSENWKDAKPTSRHTGISHCFKYIRLESYEDVLNNLRLDENPERKKAVEANATLHEDYMLRYMLDVETRGSQSLLNIDAFADPTAYTLDVKKPGSDEVVTRNVDLIETFHFLIGLRVEHIAMPQSFNAKFTRTQDPALPEEQDTRLVVDGRVTQDAEGSWWFRKIEGWVPRDSANPNNGLREKVLVVWRKLTGDLEKDNLMLDEWFQKDRIGARDFEFDTIYVNGSNNLPNLKQDDENWTVRLIEEEFMKRMWDVEGI